MEKNGDLVCATAKPGIFIVLNNSEVTIRRNYSPLAVKHRRAFYICNRLSMAEGGVSNLHIVREKCAPFLNTWEQPKTSFKPLIYYRKIKNIMFKLLQ